MPYQDQRFKAIFPVKKRGDRQITSFRAWTVSKMAANFVVAVSSFLMAFDQPREFPIIAIFDETSAPYKLDIDCVDGAKAIVGGVMSMVEAEDKSALPPETEVNDADIAPYVGDLLLKRVDRTEVTLGTPPHAYLK